MKSLKKKTGNIQKIMSAARETADYIDLMRLPSKNQPVTNYAQLEFTDGKPALKNSGFVMFSPKEAKRDKMASKFSAFIFSPAAMALSIVNGMSATTQAGKISNFVVFGLASANMGYHIYKNGKYKKAETLVFPGTDKK